MQASDEQSQIVPNSRHVKHLLAQLALGSCTEREEAACALAQHSSSAAISALRAALDDVDPGVRMQARFSLITLGEKPAPEIPRLSPRFVSFDSRYESRSYVEVRAHDSSSPRGVHAVRGPYKKATLQVTRKRPGIGETLLSTFAATAART